MSTYLAHLNGAREGEKKTNEMKIHILMEEAGENGDNLLTFAVTQEMFFLFCSSCSVLTSLMVYFVIVAVDDCFCNYFFLIL